MDAMTKILFLTCAGVGVATLTAHSMLPAGKRKYAIAFLLAWMVPGWGHLFLGQWKKALFFFATLGSLYLAGLWLTGFRTVGFDDNPFYFVGQFGSGLTALLGVLLGGVKAFPRADLPLGLYSPGLLYICISGLLNVIIMLNCFSPEGVASEEEKEEAAA